MSMMCFSFVVRPSLSPDQVNMSAYCSSRVARLVLSACVVDVKDSAKRRRISLFSGVT